MARTTRKHAHSIEHAKGRHLTRSRAILENAAEHAQIPRCPQTGKLQYAKPRDAAAALAVQSKLNRHQPPGSTYRCPLCDDWHLSSWAPGAYKRARNGLAEP